MECTREANAPWYFGRAALALGALLVGCRASDPLGLPAECASGRTITIEFVAPCLYGERAITLADKDSSQRVFAAARQLLDSLSEDTAKVSELSRALNDVTSFFSRQLLTDSARYHRMIDHVLVTMDDVRGTGITWINGRAAPERTPFLIWVPYPNTGLFFQPVSSVQSVLYLGPNPWVSSDTLLQLGEQLYRYALWREADGLSFPVWEYEFPFTSGGVSNSAPWRSALAQAYAIILFAENYRRTSDPKWKQRAYQVLNSLRVSWDDGGALLPDTTHGYWWEEFNPIVRIWNGAAQVVMAVGFLWQDTGDPEVKRMFDRGVEAIKYNTWHYDTGSWTLYSRTQGYNTVGYHIGCYQILDQLYTLSGDVWFKNLADKWRAYTPPPGVR